MRNVYRDYLIVYSVRRIQESLLLVLFYINHVAIEDGLSTKTGLTLNFFCGIGILFSPCLIMTNFHYINKNKIIYDSVLVDLLVTKFCFNVGL